MSAIHYDPTRHGDMPEVWREIGMPAVAVLRIGYEDSVGGLVERVVETRLFADLAFGPTLLAHCRLRDALREFRIDRIRNCVDEASGEPVEDVYGHLHGLYAATPAFALDRLVGEQHDVLRVLLYLLECGDLAAEQVDAALTETCRHLSGDERISAEALSARLAPLRGAGAQAYRAWVMRLGMRLSHDARQLLLRLANRLIKREGAPNPAQREALDYLSVRFLDAA